MPSFDYYPNRNRKAPAPTGSYQFGGDKKGKNPTTIKVGTNEVTAEQMAILENSSVFQNYIDKGIVSNVKTAKAKKTVAKAVAKEPAPAAK